MMVTLSAMIEPTTMESKDTMNLDAMSLPPVKKEGTPQEKKETPVDTTELRLMLFLSQVHKMSCMLALLAHMRDLVERLLVMDTSSLLSSSSHSSSSSLIKKPKEVALR